MGAVDISSLRLRLRLEGLAEVTLGSERGARYVRAIELTAT